MNGIFRQKLVFGFILIFLCNSFGPLPLLRAEDMHLPVPGQMVMLTPNYAPLLIKGIKIHPENPLLFDFIIDPGKSGLKFNSATINDETQRLIKYFLAALTIKEDDLWVNLSPYEKNKIISDQLGVTVLGRDMLAEDYILKQLTASLIYPENNLGKQFWQGVYAKAKALYGTVNVPVNTFNKVWIVADQAKVFERNNSAFVTRAHLKVMLEEDYLSKVKHQNSANSSIASSIIRQIILPKLEEEVNQGSNFIQLRQMYQAMILATWYKLTLKNALLNQVYSDQGKVSGIKAQDPAIKEKIFERYIKAYKKGVFNYIKEEFDPAQQERIPRKYFSGGLSIHLRKVFKSGKNLDPDAQAAMASNPAMIEARAIVEGSKSDAAQVIQPIYTGSVKSTQEIFEANFSRLATNPLTNPGLWGKGQEPRITVKGIYDFDGYDEKIREFQRMTNDQIGIELVKLFTNYQDLFSDSFRLTGRIYLNYLEILLKQFAQDMQNLNHMVYYANLIEEVYKPARSRMLVSNKIQLDPLKNYIALVKVVWDRSLGQGQTLQAISKKEKREKKKEFIPSHVGEDVNEISRRISELIENPDRLVQIIAHALGVNPNGSTFIVTVRPKNGSGEARKRSGEFSKETNSYAYTENRGDPIENIYINHGITINFDSNLKVEISKRETEKITIKLTTEEDENLADTMLYKMGKALGLVYSFNWLEAKKFLNNLRDNNAILVNGLDGLTAKAVVVRDKFLNEPDRTKVRLAVSLNGDLWEKWLVVKLTDELIGFNKEMQEEGNHQSIIRNRLSELFEIISALNDHNEEFLDDNFEGFLTGIERQTVKSSSPDFIYLDEASQSIKKVFLKQPRAKRINLEILIKKLVALAVSNDVSIQDIIAEMQRKNSQMGSFKERQLYLGDVTDLEKFNQLGKSSKSNSSIIPVIVNGKAEQLTITAIPPIIASQAMLVSNWGDGVKTVVARKFMEYFRHMGINDDKEELQRIILAVARNDVQEFFKPRELLDDIKFDDVFDLLSHFENAMPLIKEIKDKYGDFKRFMLFKVIPDLERLVFLFYIKSVFKDRTDKQIAESLANYNASDQEKEFYLDSNPIHKGLPEILFLLLLKDQGYSDNFAKEYLKVESLDERIKLLVPIVNEIRGLTDEQINSRWVGIDSSAYTKEILGTFDAFDRSHQITPQIQINRRFIELPRTLARSDLETMIKWLYQQGVYRFDITESEARRIFPNDSQAYEKVKSILLNSLLIGVFAQEINAESRDPQSPHRIEVSLVAQALSYDQQSSKPSQAMSTNPGGIDLSSKRMDLGIKRLGRGVDLRFNPAMIAQFRQGNFSGVEPVIISFKPISNVLAYLSV